MLSEGIENYTCPGRSRTNDNCDADEKHFSISDGRDLPFLKTVIDIGTNTILMLIAEFDRSTSQIKTVLDVIRLPRPGKGVDSSGNILPESFNKAVTVLNEYKSMSETYGSKEIIATATSFLRDARNKNEFISVIKDKTGIDIEILSGEEE